MKKKLIIGCGIASIIVIAGFSWWYLQASFGTNNANSSGGINSSSSTTAGENAASSSQGSNTVGSQNGTVYPTTIARNVSYGPDAAEILDICTPRTTYSAAPAVLLIHGGGWTSGDATKFDTLCQTLASHGIVAASVGYRLVTATTNRWPAQLEDAQLAVRWMRANAATYHIDSNRMCSWGESAGGHLAVFLGVLKTIQPGDRANLYSSESPSVSCVVDDYGPVDLSNIGGAQADVSRLLGPVANLAQAERAASPLFLVNASSPPMLIIQGDADKEVDPSQSQRLHDALTQAGVQTQLITYQGGHGFMGTTKAQRTQYDDLSIQFIVKTIGSLLQ